MNKYLLKMFNIPCAILNSGDSGMNKRDILLLSWSVPSSRKERKQTSKKVTKKHNFSAVKGKSMIQLSDWQRSGGNKDLFAQMASGLMLNDGKTSSFMADKSTSLQGGWNTLTV